MDALQLKQYIYDNNKIEYILEEIGCHGIRSNKNDFRCGLPNHRNTTSVSVKKNENVSVVVYDSSDDIVRGDIITLTMHIFSEGFKHSVKRLHSMLGLEYKYKPKKEQELKATPLDIFKSVKTKVRGKTNIADIDIVEDYILGEYIPNLTIEWLREGIISKTAREFSIMYDYDSRRIIIPHYSYAEPDKIVGIVGRTTVECYDVLGIPKYLHIKPYLKTLNLYGLAQNYSHILNAGYITLHEAEKSTLKRHSRNDKTGVSLCQHSISDEQFRIISGLDIDEVVISLDKGVSEQHNWSICERFWGIKKVSYIWDKYDVLQDKEAPADKSDKIYRWLFKNRIAYDDAKRREYLSGRT